MPGPSFTFFWTAEHPLSQWHPSVFTVDGLRFQCAEQFMMHEKAMLFGDLETAARILAATTPGEHKALGRQVQGFNATIWTSAREDVVYRGNRAKFDQSPSLLKALLGTGDSVLVEASPTDLIWGVGLAAEDPDIQDPSKWKGLNLLGNVLMRVRTDLLRVLLSNAPE